MIVSFFSRGTGGGSGPVDYLLGSERDRDKAKVLRGHPDETVALIDASSYAKKYTSGVLSFEEATLTEENKRAVMDSFEECLFSGMDKDQYNVLWVEHTDKGRLELNFVIPNVELTTGKRLQPYYHGADMKRVDAWRTIENLTHGFSDPDDPAKRQTLMLAKDLPRNKKEAAKEINDGLLALAEQGAITNRQEVVQTLEAAGFEMARQTKSYISIKDPDGGRNIRLRGAFYEQDFQLSQNLQGDIDQRSREHQQRATERLAEARERYAYGLEKKRAELKKRYQRKPETIAERHLYESKTHEHEPIQDMGLGNRLASRSSAWADRLEHMAGLNDLRAESEYSARRNGTRELARESGDSERGHYNLFNTEREKSETARGLPSQQRALDYQSEKIDDRAREAIARYVENIKYRSEDTRREHIKALREFGRRAHDERTELNRRIGSFSGASVQIGDVERASSYLDRAKSQADRAIRAVGQFIKAVISKTSRDVRER